MLLKFSTRTQRFLCCQALFVFSSRGWRFFRLGFRFVRLPLSCFVDTTQGLVKRAEQAKVAVFACGLEMSSTETKGTVLIRTGEELMSYNKVGAATSPFAFGVLFACRRVGTVASSSLPAAWLV